MKKEETEKVVTEVINNGAQPIEVTTFADFTANFAAGTQDMCINEKVMHVTEKIRREHGTSYSGTYGGDLFTDRTSHQIAQIVCGLKRDKDAEGEPKQKAKRASHTTSLKPLTADVDKELSDEEIKMEAERRLSTIEAAKTNLQKLIDVYGGEDIEAITKVVIEANQKFKAKKVGEANKATAETLLQLFTSGKIDAAEYGRRMAEAVTNTIASLKEEEKEEEEKEVIQK